MPPGGEPASLVLSRVPLIHPMAVGTPQYRILLLARSEVTRNERRDWLLWSRYRSGGPSRSSSNPRHLQGGVATPSPQLQEPWVVLPRLVWPSPRCKLDKRVFLLANTSRTAPGRRAACNRRPSARDRGVGPDRRLRPSAGVPASGYPRGIGRVFLLAGSFVGSHELLCLSEPTAARLRLEGWAHYDCSGTMAQFCTLGVNP